MSMLVSASSNALSYLQSLMQQGMSGAGDAAVATDPLSLLLNSAIGSPDQSGQTSQGSALPGMSGSTSPFGTQTLGALLSAQGQDPQTAFAQLDGNSDGQVSKSELENTLGQFGVSTSDADAIFSKLDANGDGSVTQSEFDSAKTGHAHGHHHHGHVGGAQGGGSGESNSSSSTSNADGSTTQTTTNPDGTTTTITTYADGTTMTSTSQPTQMAGQSSANAANPDWANLMQTFSQLQTQFTDPLANLLSTIA